MASSDPKGAVSASTRNSPGAQAESPVERRMVQETGRISDRVNTRQTTAAHAAEDRSRRDPPGKTPSRGPERVRRGARNAPLPRQGPAAGTKSPVRGWPPRAPRSHQVKPGATAPGVGEGTKATGKPTGAPRATGPDNERRTNAGQGGTPERHAAGHHHGTRTGAKPQRPPDAANPGSAHNTRQTAARDKVPRTAGPPRPHTAPTASGKQAQAARPKGRVVRAGRAPLTGRPTPGQDAPPPGALVPPPQRATPAPKSARCGVGDGSPRPHPPQPQPVGSGPQPHAPQDEWSGVGGRLTPDAPHPGRRRPPPAPSYRPHSAQTARCGVGDGYPRPHLLHPQSAGSGPRPHARTDERSGIGECPTPYTPHPGKRRPPPGTLMPPPQSAKPARKSVRCGVGDGSPRPWPQHR